jgi:hypothetical protein
MEKYHCLKKIMKIVFLININDNEWCFKFQALNIHSNVAYMSINKVCSINLSND